MPSFEEIAGIYAAQIRNAVHEDTRQKMIKKASFQVGRGELSRAIARIAKAIDNLEYDDNSPVEQSKKDFVVEHLASLLKFNNLRFRRLIKGGSIDSLMTMTQELEELFKAVRNESK